MGAGAGLSAAAGLSYSGPRFAQNFGDFIEAFGLTDMYSAGFYPYPDQETYWAYWSRHIWLNRYAPPPGQPYLNLLELLRNKDWFVLTTNVDHQFQKAGFSGEQLFYTQGDYGLWQCARPCRQTVYENRRTVERMVREQTLLRVPSQLVPRCPVCGGPMAPNLRCDEHFVEAAGWHAARRRYEDFCRRTAGRRLLLLELGVGSNTPGIIKYPFQRRAAEDPQARYACINRGEAFAPRQLTGRAICINMDLAEALSALKEQ